MANAKLNFKTPLAPLMYVTIGGKGKLKMDAPENSEDPKDYYYTATVRLTKDQADKINEQLAEFWRKNKPKGVGKQKYELIKPEMKKVLDENGEVVKDEDDEVVKEPTGFYLMSAKTNTVWPDGKPQVVKALGSAGQLLPEDHPIYEGCGEGTEGIIHGQIGINAYKGNEGQIAA